MKVTYNWLKQYVDFDWSTDQLAEKLTMLGLEVEAIRKIGGELEGIVVAEILATQKHPAADKLSVCRVADGQGERQIVCGATNYKVGDKVPLILPGHALPAQPGATPFTIKVSKMRGVESQGMMCSPRELGISEEAAGLMILPAEAPVGQPLAQWLGRSAGDTVYDLEITPNRPDWNSVIGIAREIGALSGGALRLPEVALPGPLSTVGAQPGSLLNQQVAVRIEDMQLCPRYVARVLRGVRVGPSPDWLRHALEKVGIRSISNVVDVTNYVMLETGHPLHAFDFHLLAPGAEQRPLIRIRRADEGESFVTLDEQKHKLTSQMLLIADEQKAIALAGIMGGANTEINNQTSDVLLESAYFKSQNIRATAKALSLRTESSYRFERGADPDICEYASARAAQLILETAGGHLVQGVIDAYPHPHERRVVSLRFHKTDELLGVCIPAPEQSDFLRRLGLNIIDPTETNCAVEIPSFRVDLKREIDLIEEVCRLYGVDRIPSSPPRGAIGVHPFDSVHDQLMQARRLLTGLGLNEAQGQTLLASRSAALAVGSAQELITLENPLSSDMDVLRPSLLPGLLDALKHNLSRKNNSVQLFELGRVFNPPQERESWRLALAVTGQRHELFWTGAQDDDRLDAYDLKGALEEFLDQFGLRGVSYSRRPEPTSLFIESATLQLGKQPLGQLGQLLPTLAREYDLRDPVFLAELDLDQILARRIPGKPFKNLAVYPAVRRDIAMVLPESTTHEAILRTVKQAKPEHLESVVLFDLYRGPNIPDGQKSLAYAFTYRHPERSLTDAEINAVHQKVIDQCKRALQASIREASA